MAEHPALVKLRALRPKEIQADRARCVAELRADGWSVAAIASALGVSRQAVYEWDVRSPR